MADRDRIEEWLQRLQSGRSSDLAEFFVELQTPLAARLQAQGQSPDARRLDAVLERGKQDFADFRGHTADELLNWLSSLATRDPSTWRSPPATNGEVDHVGEQQEGDDQTMVGPPTFDETLQVPATDGTMVKPAAMDDVTLQVNQPVDNFEVAEALRRADVLSWRFQERWQLTRIAKQLGCGPVQAAAALRVALGQRYQDDLSLPAEVQPVDATLADVLRQIDRGELLDRKTLSQQHAEHAEVLTRLWEQWSRYEEETIASGQTLVVGSESLARQREQAPAGQPFGEYELLEVIAKGGMGVVHKARQRKLNRIVAIKTILAGQFADTEDINRFYSEAEAAANLRHPNIVSIHEIGECDGQHFFSMDFIDGASLGDLVRENAMPARTAAEYTKTIADAMQYAHQQGILHRDLKPSNILVDDKLTPLITDFGLAKQVDGQSQMTMSGTIIGTPSYMPPEQAAGRIDDVDVRSDVYSMGAILYELLTGSPPFRSSSPFETIRQVLETEPVAPRMLNGALPVDLETICLKCLQKEQGKRYQSAEELAAELERFLEGEPILARPIGRMERTWRWCRRNPKMAGLAAATVLAFLATFVTVTVAYVQTTAALAGEKIARADAEESYQQARSAVDEFFTTVAEDKLLNRYGMQPVRKELLMKALNYYRDFLKQRRNDPTIADEVAMTLYRVGFISDQMGDRQQAMDSFEQARRLQQDLVDQTPDDPKRLHALSDTLVDIARIQLAGDAEAEKLQKQVIDLRRRMVTLDKGNPEYARELANGHMNLGILFRERAKRSQGESEMAAAIGNPSQAEALQKDAKRQHELALQAYQRAQSIRREFLGNGGANRRLQMNYGMGFFNLAQAAADRLDVASAEANYRNAIEVFQQLRDAEQPDFATELNLATCHRVLADHYSKHGDHQQATENYDTAESILTPLALRNPDELNFARALADTHKNRGQALFERQRVAEAIARLRQAREFERGLAERHPELPRDRDAYHGTSFALAEYHLASGETDQARESLQSLREYYAKVLSESLSEHPEERAKAELSFAEVAIALADLYASLDQLEDALTSYEEAVEPLRRRVASTTDLSQSHIDFATTLLQLAQIAGEVDRRPQARQALDEAIGLLEKLREGHGEEDWFQQLSQFAEALDARLKPLD